MSRLMVRAGLVTLAVALAACGSGSDDDAADDGDTTETTSGLSTGTVATPEADIPEVLVIGEDYTFAMPEGESSARFSVDIPAGAVVTVNASAPDTNTSFASLSVGPSGQSLTRLDVDPGSSGSFTWITSGDSSVQWTLEVMTSAPNVVSFQVEAPLQADGGIPGDAGSQMGAATAVELGVPLTGLLGDEDAEDWYVIPLSGGDVVTVGLDMLADTGSGGVSAEIMFNGQGVKSVQVFPGGEEEMSHIFAEDEVGEAQLRVSGNGNYGFTIQAGPQKDGGTDGDAGGDLSTAKPAEFGLIEGIVGGSDTDDYYVFDLPKDAMLTLEATGPADQLGPAQLTLYYNGNRIDSLQVNPGQTDSIIAPLLNEEGDALYLQVSGLGGAYAVTLEGVSQPDGGDGAGDAPGEQGLAKEITAEGTFAGILGNDDNQDWYRFTASATAPLTITLAVDASYGANTNLEVFSAEGRQLVKTGTGPGGSSALTVEVEAGVEYFLKVQTGRQAAYTLTFG